MLILALDASTPVTTVAVARAGEDGREVLAEVSTAARGASETLLPAAHAALELAGEGLDAVERVLAGVGPGTFTGIRIAAATARALSLGTGATLSRNSTLAALAAPALSSSGDVLAVLDARRRQVFAQRFSTDGPATGILCVEPEDLELEGDPLVVGDGAVRYREALSHLGRISPDGSPLHRVTAWGHVISADLVPVGAEELVPIYVREPDAEVRRDLNPLEPPVNEPAETGPFLRRMEASDLHAAMELDALALPRPWSEAIWRGELESQHSLYLVLEEDGHMVAHIGVRQVLDELHVTTVAVKPAYRRRGHARALIGAAFAAFPQARYVHLEVRPSNEAAVTLYESLGFRTTGRRPRYYGDEDALLMTLDLREDRP